MEIELRVPGPHVVSSPAPMKANLHADLVLAAVAHG